jgi:hypothetical protein
LGGRVDADAAVSANPEPTAARHEREEALDSVYLPFGGGHVTGGTAHRGTKLLVKVFFHQK